MLLLGENTAVSTGEGNIGYRAILDSIVIGRHAHFTWICRPVFSAAELMIISK